MKRKQDNLRLQVAALPLRRAQDGGLEACLVTSRETRRWLVPKGWPVKGAPARRSAALEAREEAGLVGRISKRPIGSYRYWKRFDHGWELLEVMVFRLDVGGRLKGWPEKGQREIRWLSLGEAAALIADPELQDLVNALPGRRKVLRQATRQRPRDRRPCAG